MTKPRILYVLIVVAVGVLVTIYLYRRDLPGLYDQYMDSRVEVDTLRDELSQLESKESTLREEVKKLDNDPLELEAAIRSGKGLVREGETIYRVPLPSESPPN